MSQQFIRTTTTHPISSSSTGIENFFHVETHEKTQGRSQIFISPSPGSAQSNRAGGVQYLKSHSRPAAPETSRLTKEHLDALTKALDADEVARTRYAYLVIIEQALKFSVETGYASIPSQTIEKGLPQLVALKDCKFSTGLQDLMFCLLLLTAATPPHGGRSTAHVNTQTTDFLTDPNHSCRHQFATSVNGTFSATSFDHLSESEASQADEEAWADTQPNEPPHWEVQTIPMPGHPLNWGTTMPTHGLMW